MLKSIFSKKQNTTEGTQEDEMSFLDHLEQLRWHIIRAVSWVTVFAVVAFLAKDFIFRHIIFAPRYADFFSYHVMCSFAELINMKEVDRKSDV